MFLGISGSFFARHLQALSSQVPYTACHSSETSMFRKYVICASMSEHGFKAALAFTNVQPCTAINLNGMLYVVPEAPLEWKSIGKFTLDIENT